MCGTKADAVHRERKQRLLTAVSALAKQASPAGRRDVLEAIAELEQCNEISGSPDGRWALIFSTQASPPSQRGVDEVPLLQPVMDAMYAAFFRVAPALAGAQADGGGSGRSNEQALSLATGRVNNRVRLELPWSPGSPNGRPAVLEIGVDGSVREEGSELAITFTDFSVGVRGSGMKSGNSVRLPLPRPVGSLVTTHCDEDLRISRGGRGGVFVLRRLRSTAGSAASPSAADEAVR
jgi:hypothetical protein